MPSYIERDALYEKTAKWESLALQRVEQSVRDGDITEWRKWSAVLAERSAFKFDVADAPAADVQPVVHGRWEMVGGYCTPGGDPVWRCSNCHKGTHVYGIEHGTYGKDVSDGQWVACPNCGAKMDLEG